MAGRVSRFGKGQTVRKNAALSLSVHGQPSMSAHTRRLTWKRSVVRIYYSPPFVLCAKKRGFRVFSSTRKPARRRAGRVFYNTLQHSDGFRPARAESVRTNEIEANGVGFRQPRPLVLLRTTARGKEAEASPATSPRSETHDADGSTAQDGGRGRRPVLGGTYAPDTPTRSGGRVRL